MSSELEFVDSWRSAPARLRAAIILQLANSLVPVLQLDTSEAGLEGRRTTEGLLNKLDSRQPQGNELAKLVLDIESTEEWLADGEPSGWAFYRFTIVVLVHYALQTILLDDPSQLEDALADYEGATFFLQEALGYDDAFPVDEVLDAIGKYVFSSIGTEESSSVASARCKEIVEGYLVLSR